MVDRLVLITTDLFRIAHSLSFEQKGAMAERAEYEAIRKSLVKINKDLGGADPKSMVPALLGKKLINPNDGQKIELEKTDIDRAQLIASTILKKVNASPKKMFANFLTFLKDLGLDELLNTVITQYGEYFTGKT